MKTKTTSTTLLVSTKIKELPHVQKMKAKFEFNRATILKEVELREIDYEMQFFEAGCLFLEQIFGYGSANYNNYTKDSKYMFWAWFSAEFKILENDFINVLIGGETTLKIEHWSDFVKVIPHESQLEQSFYNYRKYVKV